MQPLAESHHRPQKKESAVGPEEFMTSGRKERLSSSERRNITRQWKASQMASQSEPNTPAKEATGHALNWNWLSARIEPGANLMLSDWLDDQLSELEAAFSDFTTEKSLSRSLHRPDENQSRR